MGKKYRGVDNCQLNITKSIFKGEWTYIGVVSNIPFTYTVGLRYKRLPELIMFGVPPKMAMQIMHKYASAMVKRQMVFPNGCMIHKAANMPLVVLDVIDDKYKKKYFVHAFNHYWHWDFEVQQLIAPDAKGLYPWESGFSKVLEGAQPILGAIPDVSKIDYLL